MLEKCKFRWKVRRFVVYGGLYDVRIGPEMQQWRPIKQSVERPVSYGNEWTVAQRWMPI